MLSVKIQETIPKKLFGTNEAAKILGISVRGLFDITQRREISHMRIGNRSKYSEADINAFIAQATIPAKQA